MELEDRLMNTVDNYTCVYWIEQYLLKCIYRFDDYNIKRLQPVMTSVFAGETDVITLAGKACLGYKQFKRIFTENVGLNPKEFIRIKRFSKALHLLQSGSARSLSDISYQCGYYDKSHLIKDMKLLSGYSPSQITENSDSYSDYKSLFQSFFINTNLS